MKAILRKFNISERLTKPRLKQKEFNEIQYNVPMKEDLNFMCDLLHLPETVEGYKYLLVVVDLATKEFDCQPLKEIKSKSTVKAMEKIFKRPYLKKPYSSIQADGGAEFNRFFTQWCNDNDILLKRTVPYRHQQNSMIESLNRQLGRLFAGYMNMMEKKEGEVYREWDDILDDVRIEMNKFRKREMPKNVSDYEYPFFDQTEVPRFKVGDWVHYKLDYPRNALNKKQPTPNFREGDYRYSHKAVKIVKVIQMNTKPFYRYMLENTPNASYSEYELLKSYKGEKRKKKPDIIEIEDDDKPEPKDEKKPKTDIKPVVDKKEKSTRKSTRTIKANTKYLDV